MSKITLMLKLFRDERGQIRPTQAVSQASKKIFNPITEKQQTG